MRQYSRRDPKPDRQVNRNTAARAIRESLFRVLGEKCLDCEETRREKLTFDVIIPVANPPDHHGKMSFRQRMIFYRRQHERANLAVRCSPCNSRKGRNDPKPVASDDPY